MLIFYVKEEIINVQKFIAIVDTGKFKFKINESQINL